MTRALACLILLTASACFPDPPPRERYACEMRLRLSRTTADSAHVLEWVPTNLAGGMHAACAYWLAER